MKREKMSSGSLSVIEPKRYKWSEQYSRPSETFQLWKDVSDGISKNRSGKQSEDKLGWAILFDVEPRIQLGTLLLCHQMRWLVEASFLVFFHPLFNKFLQ